MRRNLAHVKHLLDLVQAYASEEGIFYDDLVEKWEASSGNPDIPLKHEECFYLVNLCADAGFLSLTGSSQRVQMTWAGHDYLDAETVDPKK